MDDYVNITICVKTCRTSGLPRVATRVPKESTKLVSIQNARQLEFHFPFWGTCERCPVAAAAPQNPQWVKTYRLIQSEEAETWTLCTTCYYAVAMINTRYLIPETGVMNGMV